MLASIFSLWFYAHLPAAMPTDAEYQDAAKAVRAEFVEGDAVAVAPEWADKFRMVLHGYPFVAVPDLLHTDLSQVKRLWLLELPSLPRSNAEQTARALSGLLQPDGEPKRFGKLVLQRYTNANFLEPKFDFTRDLGRANVSIQFNGQRMDCPRDGEEHHCPRGPTISREWREIDFAPYRCIGANALGRPELVVEYPDALLGQRLEVLAGVTGEMGWKHSAEYTPVKLTVDVDGKRLGELVITPGTVPPQRMHVDTSSLDLQAMHDVRFAVTSDNPKEREFCFDARAY